MTEKKTNQDLAVRRRYYPADTEYYIMMTFDDKITKKQDKSLSRLLSNNQFIKGRGIPKYGLPSVPSAERADYAITFHVKEEADKFMEILSGIEYIKELCTGKITYLPLDN